MFFIRLLEKPDRHRFGIDAQLMRHEAVVLQVGDIFIQLFEKIERGPGTNALRQLRVVAFQQPGILFMKASNLY